MGESFLDALRSRAHDSCVGRDDLKSRLLEVYAGDALRLLFLVGAGGIGKTTLANWLATTVRGRRGAVAWVSGEQIAPNTEAFMDGLRVSTDPPLVVDLAAIGRRDTRDLVVVDSFEKLRSMQRWVLQDFLAMIGPNVMVVLVGRERLAVRDRIELGLNDVLVELPVEPLPDDSANELLIRAGVRDDQRAAIIATGRGFPLALQLLAERPPSVEGTTETVAPNVLDALVDAFISRAPSTAHVQALYATAISQTVNAPLLAAILDQGDGEEIFDWLGQTSIMERTGLGISPHALVREVLFSHLQQRNPDLLERMQARLIDALAQRMLNTDVTEAHELLLQAFYARRNAPCVKQYLALELAQRCDVVSLVPQTLREIRLLIERFEDAVGLRSFEYWLGRNPRTHVVVGSDGAVKSFQVIIRVPRDAPAEDLEDPLVATAWRVWRARNPPIEDGDLYLFRWFVESESYQEFTSAMTHLMTIGPLITIPISEIAQICFASSPPEQWAPLAQRFQLEWTPDVEVQFSGRRFGFAFGNVTKMKEPAQHTAAPALNAIRGMVYILTGMSPPAIPLAPASVPAALTRETFARMLRVALNHLNEPQQLRDPALAALVPASPTRARSIEVAISEVVTDGIRRLAAAVGTARYADILEATYVRVTAKQHVAAMDLGLPYGTYRYQLRKAVSVLEDELWHHVHDGT